MTVSVIGAGIGRTGTVSLKLALELLEFGRCYHMVEWIAHPTHNEHWRAAMRERRPDWDSLFAGYGAGADFPVCLFYRELAAHYPEARFILTVRDSQSWYQSALKTIYTISKGYLNNPDVDAATAERGALINEFLWEGFFGGRFEEPEHAMAVFEEHNRAVQRDVPADRLLVYEISQGWQPLCDFLGVPVPDAPFPRSNTRAEFLARFGSPEHGPDA